MNRADRALSVLGAMLCVAGWAALISGSMIETGTFVLAGRFLGQRDVMIIGQSLLLTGSMLVFLATMRSGFGALDRFFLMALERARRSADDRSAEAAPLAATPAATRLSIEGRACMRLEDGSILVETLLGVKRFRSQDEARAFLIMLPQDHAADAPPLNL